MTPRGNPFCLGTALVILKHVSCLFLTNIIFGKCQPHDTFLIPKITSICHFLRIQKWQTPVIFWNPKMTDDCHFCQFQKWQAPVIFFKSRNDRWLSFLWKKMTHTCYFFSHAKTGAETPMFLGGGAQTHFQTSVTTPEPPMFLEGGLRNKSKMAQIEPNLSPPSKNMGGSGVVTDTWKWVWAPP